MSFAYWMLLAAALLPYAATYYFKFAGGGLKTYDNSAPRAGLENLPPPRRRAYWAQQNGFEAFPPFAAAVIVAHLASVPQIRIDVAAGVFVALRVIYTLLYIHDRPTARSLTWAAAFSSVVALFVAAATG